MHAFILQARALARNPRHRRGGHADDVGVSEWIDDCDRSQSFAALAGRAVSVLPAND
jgi:hypothetical protein